MTNTPSWVAKDTPVRTRARPVQTSAQPEQPAVRVRTREAVSPKIERVWPNGSAVFVRNTKPRKAYQPAEVQPGFLGRVVREGQAYRVHRWTGRGYTDLGTSAQFHEALIRLGGKP